MSNQASTDDGKTQKKAFIDKICVRKANPPPPFMEPKPLQTGCV